MFGMGRNRGRGRGMLLTLLGMGAGAVTWWGINRGRNANNDTENSQQSLQKMFSNAMEGDSRSQAAFAEELLPEVTTEKNSSE